jgi:hypothetical protein
MTRNVGGADKRLRIPAGIVPLALGLIGPLGWRSQSGPVPLVTGLVGDCPVFSLLGFGTWPSEPRSA